MGKRIEEKLGGRRRTKEDLARLVSKLYTLVEVSALTSSSLELRRVLDMIMRYSRQVLDAEASSLMLIDEETNELVFEIAQGEKGEAVRSIRLKVGEGIAGWVAETGQPLLVSDAKSDPRFYRKADEVSQFETKSVMCVPLLRKDQVIGVVEVLNKLESAGGPAFNEEDLEIFKALANHASIAIENAKLYELATVDGLTKVYIHRYFQLRLAEELKRAMRYNKNLSLIMLDIDHFKRFNDTYGHQQGDAVLVNVARLLKKVARETDIVARYGGEEFALILPETDGAGAGILAERLRSEVENHRVPSDKGFLQVTISLGVASYPQNNIKDKDDLIKKADMALYNAKRGGRNRVCLYEDRLLEEKEAPRKPEQLSLVDQLKLEKEDLARRLHRLSVLLKVGKAISSEIALDPLLDLIVSEITPAMSADRTTLYLVDSEKGEIWTKVIQAEEIKEIRLPLGSGIAGYVAETGEVLNIVNAYSDPRFNKEIDKKTGYRTKTILCIPMKNHLGKIIGVVQVINKKDGAFTEEDVELLEALASQASIAIENAWLYAEQKRSFESFIETLAATIDARDPLTAGHSKRVTIYSVGIAREMGFSVKEREIVRYAALLHDFGKVRISDSVLCKPGRLTDDEYNVMKMHPQYTKEMLQSMHFTEDLRGVPAAAAHHHERLDGKGYPDGLLDGNIPIGARIIAVADIFDALTSKRHYRSPMDINEVFEILEKERGDHLDGDVVDAFRRFYEKNAKSLAEQFSHLEDLKVHTLA
ncbi:MAG: diguanylate cyclase [bacterium]